MYSDTNENDLTPNSDGSPQTDTNNTNINNNNTSDPQDKVDGSQTSPPKKPISEARLRANRQNAQQSTGPRTTRGKGHSRRNALNHGLLRNFLSYRATSCNPSSRACFRSLASSRWRFCTSFCVKIVSS